MEVEAATTTHSQDTVTNQILADIRLKTVKHFNVSTSFALLKRLFIIELEKTIKGRTKTSNILFQFGLNTGLFEFGRLNYPST